MEQLDDIVLLKIFSYLSLKSIESCEKVCNRWSRLANEIKSKRKNLVKSILYANRNEADFLIKTELDSLRVEPEFTVVFLTENCAEKKRVSSQSSDSPSPNKRLRNNNANYSQLLRENLQMKSKIVYIYTSGVVGTNYENTKVTEREKSSEIGIGGLIFSKNDHFRVNLVKITNGTKLPTFKEAKEFYKVLKMNLETDELKFLMVLGNKKHHYTKLDTMFRFINQNLKDKFPVSGGFASTFGFRDDDDYGEASNIDTILLAFIGDSKVNAAQIVIPYEDNQDERIKLVSSKFEELKSKIQIQENNRAFAFQITCCSRGRAYYENKENYEAQEFRKVFPGVLLTGMFSYGELGVDFLDINSQSSKKNIEWLGFTSVFTILSF